MGCAEMIGYALGGTAAVAEQKARLENMKKGKTEEQKNVIDFFMNLYAGCGCGVGSRGAKMTMNQYQQIVSNKLYSLNQKQRAMDKIGLDESEINEIPPIVLSGYDFDSNDVLVRVIDDVAVSSRFSVSWIFFSATQLYAYTYTFETISDNTWEQTQDFFYQDITSFTTLQKVVEKIDITSTGCIKKGENIMKNNYIVDSLKIIVPGNSFSFSMRNNESLEQSIQAAKAMLRERKFAKY